MVVVKNLVQENEETEGKGNEEDGEKSQNGEERQKHLEMFTVLINNVMKYSSGTLKNIAKNVLQISNLGCLTATMSSLVLSRSLKRKRT